MKSGRRTTRWRMVGLLYLALLALSYAARARWVAQDHVRPNQQSVTLLHSFDPREDPLPVRIAYRDIPSDVPGAPAILLLHGSPFDGRTFDHLARFFSGKYRVIIPDMAGYGGSSLRVPDYGLETQARLVLELLDEMGEESVHVVGYSFGGGVGIVVAHLAPGRVRSLVLLSSIGVQEFELLGDYHINHLLHGAALLGVGFLTYATPHFGVMDRFPLNVGFARSFFDSDQRPLRGMLEGWTKPALILHGENDVLVPIQAAEEHHRILPQSEMKIYPGGHGVLFADASRIARDLEEWVGRVEAGEATARSDADPERTRRASLPYEVLESAPLSGALLGLIFLLIVAGTLISEDLACIAAGLLAARGSISVLAAMTASFAGILLGDVLLYAAGRWIGRPALERPPLRWFVRTSDLERSRRWMERRNPTIILSSRFIPGARLPTYFGAGVLRARFGAFFLYCVLAGALWTPFLTGLAYVGGGRVWRYYAAYSGNALFALLATLGVLFIGVRLSVAMATAAGRQRLRTRFRRLRHWEFWPPWAAYAPVLPYLLFLAARHRSLTLFTAANPGIPMGGFVGESKSAILSSLGSDAVARFRVIPSGTPPETRLALVRQAMRAWGADFPVVLKPDVGERGRGVAVLASETQVRDYLAKEDQTLILQDYVEGLEFGVFYYRMPGAGRGRIFSITEKRPTRVEGDGTSTLESLILNDSRASCQAPIHLEQNRNRLDWVPEAGEEVVLNTLGTHSRGSLFLNGTHYRTQRLEEAVEEISRTFDGFCFGRYDLRVPCLEDLMGGRNLTVIELNGVTSEATHIYDPDGGALMAYRTLFRQWRLAFQIGARNRELGHEPASVVDLATALVNHYRRT